MEHCIVLDLKEILEMLRCLDGEKVTKEQGQLCHMLRHEIEVQTNHTICFVSDELNEKVTVYDI